VVKGNDLVVSTQGRAFWILDDLSPLRQLVPSVTAGQVHLFEPALRRCSAALRAVVRGRSPRGVLFYYWLKNEPREKEEVTLEILDPAGKLIRRLSNKGDEDSDAGRGGGRRGRGSGRLGSCEAAARAGLTARVELPDSRRCEFKGLIMWGGSTTGPEVVPGQYQAKISAGGGPTP